MAAGKKGTPEPAPLGAVVEEHWRARSVLGTLPDGQKTGLWRTLNQVTCFHSCKKKKLTYSTFEVPRSRGNSAGN